MYYAKPYMQAQKKRNDFSYPGQNFNNNNNNNNNKK